MNDLFNSFIITGGGTVQPVEMVSLSLNEPSGGTAMSVGLSLPRDGSSVIPNTVAFDSLLAGIDSMDADQLNGFYEEYISAVVSINDYDLLRPIPVTALPRCTTAGLQSDVTSATWASLGDEPTGIAQKRAYVEQFILANRSNQTRAAYLTNHLVGSFTLPIWQ